MSSLRLSDRGRRLLLRGLAVVGYALLARTLIDHGIQGEGGSGGIDAIAYWRAGGNALVREPLYEIASFEFAAYQYPPPFAQMIAPFSVLPVSVFVWWWRAVELACLRLATGSWTAAGIAILVFPPILAELDAGNVHLLMAGAASLAMRGYVGTIAPAGLVKLSTWPLAAVGWVRDRNDFLLGAGVAGAIALLSFLFASDRWIEYRDFLAAAVAPTGAYNLLSAIPYWLRLIAAGAVGLAAVRWIRLAPIAVTLAYPVVWFHALSTLVAVAGPVNTKPVGEPVRRRLGPAEPGSAWRRSTSSGVG